ncbi:MAG TPA: hypothetical protein VEC39_01895 [Vicinamibacterales bacterium]|nr:hypothetical protein [Vicinamibacterales bacterium]
MKLLVTINGPGEAAGWLGPITDAVARHPEADMLIDVVVTPCQWASGRETPVVDGFPGVAHVEKLMPYLGRALTGRLTDRPSLVLHLGGDPVYALVLSRVLGTEAWTHGTSARFRRAFQRFLVPDERTANKLRDRSVEPGRIAVVGQLVTDSVLSRRRVSPARNQALTVAFLPGSRDSHVGALAPYYTAVAQFVADRARDVRFVMLASRFVGQDVVVSKLASAGWVPASPGDDITLARAGMVMTVKQGGVEELDGVDVAVTLPGTNTLQLAALGVPHVAIVPGHRSELIPLPGLLGLINSWGGAPVRRAILKHVSRRLPYLAIPNIIADELVVPEFRGTGGPDEFLPSDVAEEVVALLGDPGRRRAIGERLRAIAGPGGAGDRCVQLLDRWQQRAILS